MWWKAAGDWSAKAVDQFLGQDAAHKANRTNIRLAKEGREFMEKMFNRQVELDNTAVQRHVKDLSAAGLNPMLGYTGQAGTPGSGSPPVASVRPEYESGKESANPRIMETMMMDSQRRLIDAQARSTSADAALKEAEVPFSAKSAENRFHILYKQANIIEEELKNKVVSALNEPERQRLELEAKRLANMAARLGMSEREAAAKFFESAGAAGQWLQLLKGAVSIVGPR